MPSEDGGPEVVDWPFIWLEGWPIQRKRANGAGHDGLIVPVIQNADKKTLQEIAQEINSLMTKARTGQLTVKDISKGTFTLSNLGMYGVETFTPIITPGQVAVLGVGSIMKRAVVQGEGVTVQPQVSLSLTFDHRVVDGAIAAKFLSRLRQIIEAGSFTE